MTTMVATIEVFMAKSRDSFYFNEVNNMAKKVYIDRETELRKWYKSKHKKLPSFEIEVFELNKPIDDY